MKNVNEGDWRHLADLLSSGGNPRRGRSVNLTDAERATVGALFGRPYASADTNGPVTNDWLAQLADEYNVPANLLRGHTRAEMVAHATQLHDAINGTTPPTPDPATQADDDTATNGVNSLNTDERQTVRDLFTGRGHYDPDGNTWAGRRA